MKRLAVTFALACAGLALVGPAQAGLRVGVADDHPVGTPDDGAAFFALMNDVGLSEVRLSVKWDETQPDDDHEPSGDRERPARRNPARCPGRLLGHPPQGSRDHRSPGASDQFVAFLQLVAQSFPTVKNIIVGNEPNQPLLLAAPVRRRRHGCVRPLPTRRCWRAATTP